LIAQLGHDHDTLRSLVRALRRALDRDPAGVAAPAGRLAAMLEHHSALEEGGLYVELDRAGISPDQLLDEHDSVDATVRAAAEGHADAETLRQALQTLDDHINREEYDLFPGAHQLLAEDAWDRLEQHRLDHGPPGEPVS
jgi:hemerythrin-like domain-containing protein